MPIANHQVIEMFYLSSFLFGELFPKMFIIFRLKKIHPHFRAVFSFHWKNKINPHSKFINIGLFLIVWPTFDFSRAIRFEINFAIEAS